ncbi:MAG: F0F1 ATP synthase subunit delta [Gammaproteobacteria bacterium]|jgi:F-type H+-transporting ATPase subunit delta
MADFGSVARPYARAMFDIAQASGELDAWSSALACAAAVVEQPEARAYLGQPGLSDADRAQYVGNLCAGVSGAEKLASTEGSNLLALLSANDRLQACPEISHQFDQLKIHAEQKIEVKITSATPVETGLAAALSDSLRRRLGRNVELTLEVDSGLIGGAIIEAEDKVIDASVRSRLQRLAGALID